MERRVFRAPGFVMLALLLVVAAAVLLIFPAMASDTANAAIAVKVVVVCTLLGAVIADAFTTVNPDEARVVQFFGRYVGSRRDVGFYWTVPFSTRHKLSLRVRNFETARLKVSDADGNPVEIAAVDVWRVV